MYMHENVFDNTSLQKKNIIKSSYTSFVLVAANEHEWVVEQNFTIVESYEYIHMYIRN